MKLRTLALAGAAMMAMSLPAMASDTTGWYVGLGAGWAKMGDFTANITTPFATTLTGTTKVPYSVEPKDGFVVLGAVGYRFADRLRVENEVSYSQNDLNGLYGGTSYFTGDIGAFTDYVNIVYDYPLYNRWTFSFGGGLGAFRGHL